MKKNKKGSFYETPCKILGVYLYTQVSGSVFSGWHWYEEREAVIIVRRSPWSSDCMAHTWRVTVDRDHSLTTSACSPGARCCLIDSAQSPVWLTRLHALFIDRSIAIDRSVGALRSLVAPTARLQKLSAYIRHP